MTTIHVETLEIAADCATVRDLVLDQPGHATWFPDMKQVVPLEPGDRSPLRSGSAPAPETATIWIHRFLYTNLHIAPIEVSADSARWRIADVRGHVVTEWVFHFTPSAVGQRTLVTLTEETQRQSMLSRLWAKCVRIPSGHYQRKYLHALRTRAERVGATTAGRLDDTN